MLHRKLWDDNQKKAKACLQHPFVVGLGSGSLPMDAFKRYVAQDAFFLQAFLQAYAVCAAKCESLEHIKAFHGYMGGALDELNLHAQYAETLGLDLSNVVPYRATSAYTEFLLRTAWHEPISVTIAAMVPCMRLYAYLGAELLHQSHPNHPYHQWIETYSSDEFQALANDIETLLDVIGQDTPSVRQAYQYAMQCEYDFFSAPLEEPK
ncbi:MAG: TenA family protein [Candidatus Hinthialibacter antarcticus]|nr:TenA family protein [Candidatus Hinthialibacter antarcticus]